MKWGVGHQSAAYLGSFDEFVADSRYRHNLYVVVATASDLFAETLNVFAEAMSVILALRSPQDVL